jgi:hypothetical protein
MRDCDEVSFDQGRDFHSSGVKVYGRMNVMRNGNQKAKKSRPFKKKSTSHDLS